MSAVLIPTPAPGLGLMLSRHQTSPRRLLEPGPGPGHQALLFQAAAAAPDHGRLLPWRFVLVPRGRRAELGAAFAAALLERQPDAGEDEIRRARGRADRAPWLCVAVLRACDDDAVPRDERLISLGCAIQNLLLCATELGFGSGLVSGRALHSPAVAAVLGLAEGEVAQCCVVVGSIVDLPPGRERPGPEQFVSSLS